MSCSGSGGLRNITSKNTCTKYIVQRVRIVKNVIEKWLKCFFGKIP